MTYTRAAITRVSGRWAIGTTTIVGPQPGGCIHLNVRRPTMAYQIDIGVVLDAPCWVTCQKKRRLRIAKQRRPDNRSKDEISPASHLCPYSSGAPYVGTISRLSRFELRKRLVLDIRPCHLAHHLLDKHPPSRNDGTHAKPNCPAGWLLCAARPSIVPPLYGDVSLPSCKPEDPRRACEAAISQLINRSRFGYSETRLEMWSIPYAFGDRPHRKRSVDIASPI